MRASQLDLEWARNNFRSKPNPKSARWYLSTLLRYAQAEYISVDMLQEGLDEIKAWQKEHKK